MTNIEILQAELLNNQTPLYCTRKELCNAVDKAIQALQEKAGQEKGCECCNEHKPRVSIYSEYSIEIDDAKLSTWQDLKCLEIFNINYCPMCGRKLGKNDG